MLKTYYCIDPNSYDMPLISEVSNSTSEVYVDLMDMPVDLNRLLGSGGAPNVGQR